MVGPTCGPAAGGRRCASLSLLRLWKAGILPRHSASGPGGAWCRRLRRKLLLEATRSSCAPCCAWRGAKLTGASTSVASCRALREAAPGAGLPAHTSSQQLLGKVRLLYTAAATGAEQRAASATARDRAARTHWPICSLCPSRRPTSHIRRSSRHPPRPQHEEAGA